MKGLAFPILSFQIYTFDSIYIRYKLKLLNCLVENQSLSLEVLSEL